jgi:uncharacterized membrane protein (UPF0127 family)
MKRVLVKNRSRGTVLGEQIEVADSFFTRLRGLLGRDGLGTGEGLLIVPSRGVHMFGMRFPLDVLLLDDQRRVAGSYPRLEPGKATGMHRGIRYALELPVGMIESTSTGEGDSLDWDEK